MDYNEENADEAHMNEEALCRKDGGGEESILESINKNTRSSEDPDPLAESFNSFMTLQEALEQEIQKFREMGKESTTPYHGGGSGSSSELCSSRHLESVNLGQRDSNSLESELEIKSDESKSMIETNESRNGELESTKEDCEGLRIGIEDALEQKIEAEIEYLILSRSIENMKTMFEGEKALAVKMKNKKRAEEEEEESIERKKKRAWKTASCFMIQIMMMMMMVIIASEMMSPQSEIVVPT